MRKLYYLLFLVPVILLTGSNQEDFNYFPSKIVGHQLVSYTQFTLSYNEHHEQADWVAYELTRA